MRPEPWQIFMNCGMGIPLQRFSNKCDGHELLMAVPGLSLLLGRYVTNLETKTSHALPPRDGECRVLNTSATQNPTWSFAHIIRNFRPVLQETPIKTDGATVGFVKTGVITGHTCLEAGNEFLTVQYLLLLSHKNTTILILYVCVIRHCYMLYWWLKWTVETCSSVEYHKHTRSIRLCFCPIIATSNGPIKTQRNEVT